MSSLQSTLAIILAATFLGSGLIKLTRPREKLASRFMPYMEDLTDGQARWIGTLEVSAAIGLLVPTALNVVAVLTSFAATGLVLLMAAAARTHLRRSELTMLPVNLLLGAAALLLGVTSL